jgi:hypothetical protein
MLGRIDAAPRWIDGDGARIADAGGEALSGREPLPRTIGVVAPDSTPRFQLGARLAPGEPGMRNRS